MLENCVPSRAGELVICSAAPTPSAALVAAYSTTPVLNVAGTVDSADFKYSTLSVPFVAVRLNTSPISGPARGGSEDEVTVASTY